MDNATLEKLPPFAKEIIEIDRHLDATLRSSDVITIGEAKALRPMLLRKRDLVRYGYLFCRPNAGGHSSSHA